MKIPESIAYYIKGKNFQTDVIGMSDSEVLLFDELALKIEKKSPASDNELRMMRWLHGQLPVPEVIAAETVDGVNYLLMTRLDGEMACAPVHMRQPKKTVELLAEALHRVWAVKLSDLPDPPRLNDTDARLEKARIRVTEGSAPDDGRLTRRFGSAERALEWLMAHRPTEEIVFSHGDFCLPNVFLRNGAVSGFLDLGQCGAADRWYDAALCQNSLYNNFNGVFDGVVWEGWEESMLFDALGEKPDEDRLLFHLLLDELW